MNHDIDDALRARIITQSDIPRHITQALGTTSIMRIDLLVRSLVEAGMGKNDILLPPGMAGVLKELRTYLFENVYVNQLHQKERNKIQGMLKLLYEHFLSRPEELPEDARIRAQTKTDAARANQDHPFKGWFKGLAPIRGVILKSPKGERKAAQTKLLAPKGTVFSCPRSCRVRLVP
jgi:dGTPase